MDYKKQVVVFDPNADEQPEIHVVGAGALGSWLVVQLCKLGFNNITVWDADEVEEHNLPNQAFFDIDVGKNKAWAIRKLCNWFETGAYRKITWKSEMITKENVNELKGIVFNCVDTMAARKLIYNYGYKRGNIDVLIEDRLSIHGCYIYTLDKLSEDWDYKSTLYEDTEAEVSACGVSQTVVTAAFFTSSLMVDIMLSWLKRENYLRKVEVEMHGLYAANREWNKYL